MKLYKISQDENNDYDTFDSAVVMAETEEQARNMDPRSGEPMDWDSVSPCDNWCSSPDKVTVTFLAELPHMEDYKAFNKDRYSGNSLVVCASFNAG